MKFLPACGMLLLLVTSAAHACSCFVGGGCHTISTQDTFFVGTVLAVRRIPGSTSPDGSASAWPHRAYRISVAEVLQGGERPGEEVEVVTGMGGGDCGYTFQIGARYFIDADYSQGTLNTNICSMTALEEDAALTIRELKTSAAGGRQPDLSGIVLRKNPGGSRMVGMSAGVPDVSVSIDALDGRSLHTVTGDDGTYAVPVLIPGPYTVSFTLPAKLMTNGPGRPLPLLIPDVGGTGASCHVNLYAYPAGRIPVRVVDPKGHAVAGFVAAYARETELSKAFSWESAGFLGDDGRMILGPLKAGTYWVEFEPKGESRPDWYYPGTRDKAQAQAVRVEDGMTTEEMTLVITP